MQRAVALIALLVGTPLWAAQPPEPEVKGSIIDAWEATRSADRTARYIAIRNLSDFGEPAVPLLLEIWERGREGEAQAVHEAIRTLKPNAKTVADIFARDLIGHKDKEFRQNAALVLGCIPASDRTVSALIAGLKDQDPDVVYWCVRSLGEIGEPGKKACPQLAELVKPSLAVAVPEGGVRSTHHLVGIQALRNLATFDAAGYKELIISGCVQFVKNRDHRRNIELMSNGVNVLGKMGADAKETIPILVQIVGDQEVYSDVREAAVTAVTTILTDLRKQGK